MIPVPAPAPGSPGRFTSLPPSPGVETLIRVYQLPPPAIQFLTSLAEAADGVGLVRTLDEQRGIIECWIMPDFVREFDGLIAATAAQWPVRLMDEQRE
jgi:hypothetical protein